MPNGIPPRAGPYLLDGGLELGARGDLDALAGGDLDLLARLRVAARTRGGGDLLEREEAGIVTFSPLATASETAENRPSTTRPTVAWLSPVALAMLATSSVLVIAIGVVLQTAANAAFSEIGPDDERPVWSMGPPPNIPTIRGNPRIYALQTSFSPACRRRTVTDGAGVTTASAGRAAADSDIDTGIGCRGQPRPHPMTVSESGVGWERRRPVPDGTGLRDVCVGAYQLDLVTPGSSPLCAMSRKRTREMPNFDR